MNALVLLGWFTVVRFEHSDTEREFFFSVWDERLGTCG